jgi:hypothetical protein
MDIILPSLDGIMYGFVYTSPFWCCLYLLISGNGMSIRLPRKVNYGLSVLTTPDG